MAYRLELVVEPWIEGLWPALSSVLGASDVSTDPVMSSLASKLSSLAVKTEAKVSTVTELSDFDVDDLVDKLDGRRDELGEIRQRLLDVRKDDNFKAPALPAAYLNVSLAEVASEHNKLKYKCQLKALFHFRFSGRDYTEQASVQQISSVRHRRGRGQRIQRGEADQGSGCEASVQANSGPQGWNG